MSVNPQTESTFVARLPREIRDAIYLEIWRSAGLRQHIVSHWDWDRELSKATGAHFCRWPCDTQYQVEDDLQEEVELLRIQDNVQPGDSIKNVTYQMGLESAWLNHWRCGKSVEEAHNMRDATKDSTSGISCWKKPPTLVDNTTHKPSRRLSRFWRKASETTKLDRFWKTAKQGSGSATNKTWTGGPYLAMLLSCKVLYVQHLLTLCNLRLETKDTYYCRSEECLKSIYESTTFVFTDVLVWQMFVGFCEPHPTVQGWTQKIIPPPAFPKYATRLELSLIPVFSYDLTCTSPSLSAHPDSLHNPYDFHWLQLHRFENLGSVKIWVAARATGFYGKPLPQDYTKFNNLSLEALEEALSCFKNIPAFILSTPLDHDAGPDGYLEGVMQRAGHRVWRRGPGDLFHPQLERVYWNGRREGYVTVYPIRCDCNQGCT